MAVEGEQRNLRQLFFCFSPAQGWHPSVRHGGPRVVWQDGDMKHSPPPSPSCSCCGSSAASLCNICCCSVNRPSPSSACWQTSSGDSGAEAVWRLMLWLGHVCFGQLCYKSNCREQRSFVVLAVPEVSRNSEWALAWTISMCLIDPSMLQSFWSVASMLSSLRKLRHEITEV